MRLGGFDEVWVVLNSQWFTLRKVKKLKKKR